MSAADPELKTRPTKRQYRCLGCGNEALVEGKVLAPNVIGFIPAYCAVCPGNPEMSFVDTVKGN